jgi:hypothetical protein
MLRAFADLQDSTLGGSPNEAVSELVGDIARLASLQIVAREAGQTANGQQWASAIAEGSIMVFSRRYIRCQIGGMSTVNEVASILGLAFLCTPSVVLIAVTEKLSDESTNFIARVNQVSSFMFVALDGSDLREIARERSHFGSILARRSRPD